MYADGIRDLVVSELKDDLLPMMRSLPAHSSKVLLTQVLDNVWREVKDAAGVLMKRGTPEADAGMIWSCVPSSLQVEILDFVQMRMRETRNESALAEELLAFASQLFQPMYEDLSCFLLFSVRQLVFSSMSFSGKLFDAF